MPCSSSSLVDSATLQAITKLEELKRDRTRSDALRALIDSLEISLTDERTKGDSQHARISQFELQLEDLRSQVRREDQRADTNMEDLEHAKGVHATVVSKLRAELAELQALLSQRRRRRDTRWSC